MTKKIILWFSLVLFFASGCGQVQSAYPAVSIARRGESKLTPIPTDLGVAATEDISQVTNPAPSVEPSATQTPEPSVTPMPPTLTFTPTSELPTITPTATAAPATDTPQPPVETTPTEFPPSECLPDKDNAFESELIRLINKERQQAGLAPLIEQAQLTMAARLHSQDMACNDYFSHDSPSTGSLVDRITAQGYSYSSLGENIAAGYTSPADVVASWMNSSGHRANILEPGFTQIGIGYAYWETSEYGGYWTAVFASP